MWSKLSMFYGPPVDLVIDGIDWSRSFARGSYIRSVFQFPATTSKMLKRDILDGIYPAGVLDWMQGLDGHHVNLDDVKDDVSSK